MVDPLYLSVGEQLLGVVVFAALFVWAFLSCDITEALGWSDQEPEPLPQPKGGLGRRLEGDPARVLANYQLIGREWRVSRMRPCDAHWFSGRDFGDER